MIVLFKKLYVGNLPFSTTEAELRDLFGRHGSVESVKVITDRETGRSRGFAFVEMDANGAGEAIRALDGTDMGGRSLRVNEAQERSGGGGGGGFRGPRREGGGGGGGGYRGGREGGGYGGGGRDRY
jgi:RNA recognition motif-containing protein